MFVMLPLKMEGEYFRAGLVSGMIAAAILFNATLEVMYPSLHLDANGIVAGVLDRPTLALDGGLSLMRGAGPVSALVLALFWLVFGHSMEQRIGSLRLAALWLVGCVLPLPLAWAGWLSMDASYWLGLGGSMLCLGVSYCVHATEEVKFFYFVCAPPWKFGFGTSTIAGAVPLFFLHAVLSLAQIVIRTKTSLPPPVGIATPTWLFVYPFVPVVVWLASLWIVSKMERVIGARDKTE
ncbi:hypothetical protein GC173_18425 [bacterium]|nr:hypothetical protein [bacterium]